MQIKRLIWFASILVIGTGAGFAQAPPSAAPAAQTAPAVPVRTGNGCAPTEVNPQQGTVSPKDTTTGQVPEPLGDKLARSDGVLCPPTGVDPEIRAPTPDTGNTPVIPPPGSPGGDPSMHPK